MYRGRNFAGYRVCLLGRESIAVPFARIASRFVRHPSTSSFIISNYNTLVYDSKLCRQSADNRLKRRGAVADRLLSAEPPKNKL